MQEDLIVNVLRTLKVQTKSDVYGIRKKGKTMAKWNLMINAINWMKHNHIVGTIQTITEEGFYYIDSDGIEKYICMFDEN